MGRQFKISGSVPPGYEKEVKKILNRECLAYGRYKKKHGLGIKLEPGELIQLAALKHKNNMMRIKPPEPPKAITKQAEKIILPLRAIFNFEESVGQATSWHIEGYHKGRNHVTLRIERNSFQMGINYLATLTSRPSLQKPTEIVIKESSLQSLVGTINDILNFRM